MPKKKSRSSDEFHRGRIRELEKLVRQLQKQLSYYEKRDHLNDKSQDEDVALDSEDTNPRNLKTCPECAKGHLEEFEIAGRCYGTCNVCQHRVKLK